MRPLFFLRHFRSLSRYQTARWQCTTSESPIKIVSTDPSQIVDHIVLLKVKDNTNPTKVHSMLDALNGLSSLGLMLNRTMGPLYRIKSSLLPSFSHMIHSRFASKEKLQAHNEHPVHLNVVKESVLPICDDLMILDWVVDNPKGPLGPPPESAMRGTFLKLKDNLGTEVKDEILGVIRGNSGKFGGIHQLTCGEIIFPRKAKGYSIASLAVFSGVSEMEATDSKGEWVDLQKQKIGDYLDSVIVVDYVVPSPQSAGA